MLYGMLAGRGSARQAESCKTYTTSLFKSSTVFFNASPSNSPNTRPFNSGHAASAPMTPLPIASKRPSSHELPPLNPLPPFPPEPISIPEMPFCRSPFELLPNTAELGDDGPKLYNEDPSAEIALLFDAEDENV